MGGGNQEQGDKSGERQFLTRKGSGVDDGSGELIPPMAVLAYCKGTAMTLGTRQA